MSVNYLVYRNNSSHKGFKIGVSEDFNDENWEKSIETGYIIECELPFVFEGILRNEIKKRGYKNRKTFFGFNDFNEVRNIIDLFDHMFDEFTRVIKFMEKKSFCSLLRLYEIEEECSKRDIIDNKLSDDEIKRVLELYNKAVNLLIEWKV